MEYMIISQGVYVRIETGIKDKKKKTRNKSYYDLTNSEYQTKQVMVYMIISQEIYERIEAGTKKDKGY